MIDFEGCLPECARCGKPVEGVRSAYSPALQVTVFEAYCHGAVERVELTDQQMYLSAAIIVGRAFDEPPIPLLPEPLAN